MKKVLGIAAAVGLSLCMSATAFAAPEAAETESDAYLAELAGSYTELFPVMDAENAKQIWYDQFEEILGIEDEETAEMLREIIIAMFEAEVSGEDAMALAAEDPTYGSFDCYFENGLASLSFEGNTISGYDEEGNEVFSHNYTYLEDVKVDFGAMNEMYAEMLSEEDWPVFSVYESDGEDDGFKYFAFLADTPAETFHIEFRFGPTEEGIGSYYDGDYAYWLAAGFLQDAPEQMLNDVINLFVSENAASFAEMLG